MSNGTTPGGANNTSVPNPQEQEEDLLRSTQLMRDYSAALVGAAAAAGSLNGEMGRFARTMSSAVFEASKGFIRLNNAHATTSRMITDNYKELNDTFGGMTKHMLASGDSMDVFAQKSFNLANSVQRAQAGIGDSQIKYVNALGKTANVFDELYSDPTEIMKDTLGMMKQIEASNNNALKSIEDHQGAMASLIQLRKATGIEAETLNDLIQRQYAFTGEASDEVLKQVVVTATAVGEASDVSLKRVLKTQLEIMSDTKTFGDIGVDSAARISGALAQLGMDFKTFQNMTEQFMNFDTAADKMGDLSAMFGIQMDAMEMTYLANEDQEEFLFRMREEILNAGLDVENMSNARQKMLTSQMGFRSREEMLNFMKTGLTADQDEMTEATSLAKPGEAAQVAMERFADTTEGSMRTAEEAFKSRILAMSTYSIDQFALLEAQLTDTMSTLQDIKFTDDQIKNFEAANKSLVDSLAGPRTSFAEAQQTILQSGVDLTGGKQEYTDEFGQKKTFAGAGTMSQAEYRQAIADGTAGQATGPLSTPQANQAQPANNQPVVQATVSLTNPSTPSAVNTVGTSPSPSPTPTGDPSERDKKIDDLITGVQSLVDSITRSDKNIFLKMDGKTLGGGLVSIFKKNSFPDGSIPVITDEQQ